MRKYPELFEHIQQGRKTKKPEEHVATAEKLAKEHGKLPNCGWLEKNGYEGLYLVMRAHPELFEHIQQDRKTKTPEEHVADAEKLAEEHGMLPKPWWLTNNGYSGLERAMRKYPELFEHIQQDSKAGRTPEEHVATAEKLAKEHGKIPNCGWLEKNGYWGIYLAIRKCPELFEHLK